MPLIEPIRGRSNPFVRRLRALKRQGVAEDMMLLEGIRLIEEACSAGVAIVEAAVSSSLGQSDRGQTLLASLERRGVACRWLDDALLASLSPAEASQGILAVARRPICDEAALYNRQPLILVAAGIQNPGNIGALLRVAEAAGATGAYLTAGCADPYAWKALRGAMGSAFRLACVPLPSAEDVLTRLRAHGVASVASVATGGVPYDQVDLRRPVALWVGNEAAGLAAGLVQAADARVTIPMAPPVASLNVAVAAGLLFFEAARQRRVPAQ